MKENNSKICNNFTLNDNNSLKTKQKYKCNIALLHDTPLSSSQALFKAFHLVNKEWPLTNSGALLQRLKLIGSSQDLLNSNVAIDILNDNNNDKIGSINFPNANKSNLNNTCTNCNKFDFQLVYNNIPENQLPYLLPFSVVAYLEVNDNNMINNINENDKIENEIINGNDSIKIVGHSRWALAKSIFSKNSNSRQVLMDSCKPVENNNCNYF